MIAQLWVDAALNKAVCPLILITSTNVKAVENVLDSFAKIGSKIGHQRWIPYNGGFGLFMASASRETKFPTCTSDTHPFMEHESAEAVASAQNSYLSNASTHFSKRWDSVEEVVEALHGELKEYQEALKNIINARYAIFSATGNDTKTGAITICARYSSQYESEAKAEQALIESANADITLNKESIRAAEAEYETVRATIDAAEHDWSEYLSTSPLWLDLLSFLPPILRRRNARDRVFLLKNPLTAEINNRQDDVAGHFQSRRKKVFFDAKFRQAKLSKDLARAEAQKASAVERFNTAQQGQTQIKKLLKNWQAALGIKYQQMNDVSLVALNDKLDTTIRARMFCLTDHYWSGMWLIEMQERLATQAVDSKGVNKLEKKYRRFAKLSPCLVSNFHMAPAFFTAWQGEDKPLWNIIDLLVVDEAGQVSPDVGACMFALAKRALVVGDIYQIEPVWNTGEATDRANATKFGFTARSDDPRYDELSIAGYTSAQGNLMKIAGRGCSVQKHNDVRGLLLTEHRRCVPELIDYCNVLVYGGRLQPLRPALDPTTRLLPTFGTLDVRGKDKTVGSSRQNHEEAVAIIEWLMNNRERIENHYRDKDPSEKVPLWKSVGIVTPFSTQASLIESLLRKKMPDLAQTKTKLTVGTVHALQGAERDIVIFSPTYGQGYRGGMFFDKSPNMLNVAISRAKDSFLVIGNLALFDQTKKSKPSGLLATYLSAPKISGSLT